MIKSSRLAITVFLFLSFMSFTGVNSLYAQDAVSAPQGTIEVTLDTGEAEYLEKNVPLEGGAVQATSENTVTDRSATAEVEKAAVTETPTAKTAETSESGLVRPVAMMVENEPPARPQSGLYAAKFIYEIQAEEITRFMAIYYDFNENVEVGPIRSARHYFADLSTMYDAVYLHVGGSPQGLAEIKERGINNINAIKGDRGFYRTNERKIPHNLYIKLPNVKKEMIRKKFRTETGVKPPFEFYEAKKTADDLTKMGVKSQAIKKIHIPYMKSYRVGYEYSDADGRFVRLYNDKPFKDYRTSKEVMADNVVIMRCNMQIIDSKDRHDMDLYEGGTCEIAVGNCFFVGSWARDNKSGIIKYYDSSLNEVKFNPGNIIIHVVPPRQAVNIDNDLYVYEGRHVKSKKSRNADKSEDNASGAVEEKAPF